MDIPFISSGALSRAHYALVRKVEIAASLSEADEHLLAEVEHVRDRLTRSASSAVSSVSLGTVHNVSCLYTVTETSQRVPRHPAVLFHEFPGSFAGRGVRATTRLELGRGRPHCSGQAYWYRSCIYQTQESQLTSRRLPLLCGNDAQVA